jgi:hypothetical protein
MSCKKTWILALILTLSTPASWAEDTRASDSLENSLGLITKNPRSLDAEIHAIEIFRLWDRLGPGPVFEALDTIVGIKGASVRLRERARDLKARAQVRMGELKSANTSYRQRGFWNNWAVLGPFDNEGGLGFETPSDVEQGTSVNSNNSYPGKTGEIHWRRAPERIFHLGYVHIEALTESTANTCYYARTVLNADKSGRALFWVGAGGAFRAFWNGVEVLKDSAYRRPTPDRYAVEVGVRKGPNVSVIKVCDENQGNLGFYARLTDKKAEPWPTHYLSNPVGALQIAAPKPDIKRNLPGPLSRLVAQARQNPDNASIQARAAAYLLATDALDPNSHQARDFSRRACETSKRTSHCLLWAKLALDRNEARLALDKAYQTDSNSVPVLLALARLKKEGREPIRALPLIKRVLKLQSGDIEASVLEIELLANDFSNTAYELSTELDLNHPSG